MTGLTGLNVGMKLISLYPIIQQKYTVQNEYSGNDQISDKAHQQILISTQNIKYFQLYSKTMLNSSVYSRNSVIFQSNDQIDLVSSNIIPTKTSTSISIVPVQRSILFYMFQAYLLQLSINQKKSAQEKRCSCNELGKKIGETFLEVISQGFVQKFVNKDPKNVKFQHEIKFLCEKLWVEIFNKKIDKLEYSQKNNSFTLQDHKFELIKHISHTKREKQQQFINLNCQFACGVIEGVINKHGHQVDVKYSIKSYVQFQIKFKSQGSISYFSTY